jgi:hypothetical protein
MRRPEVAGAGTLLVSVARARTWSPTQNGGGQTAAHLTCLVDSIKFGSACLTTRRHQTLRPPCWSFAEARAGGQAAAPRAMRET